jgi:hypothetical protein
LADDPNKELHDRIQRDAEKATGGKVVEGKPDDLDNGLQAMAELARGLPPQNSTYEMPSRFPIVGSATFSTGHNRQEEERADREHLRQTLAAAHEQSERPTEKTTVSDGPFPETLGDAARWLIGGVFVFVAGFEGYVMIWEGRIVSGVASCAIAVVLTGLVVFWKKIPWSRKDVRWAFVAAIVAIEVIALSPFVEQHRWPFTGASEYGGASRGSLWPPLTDDEYLSLRIALKDIPKHDGIRIICTSADCRELAGNFIGVFHEIGWSPIGIFEGPYGHPIGVVLYQKDTNDRTIADAIEKGTKGRLRPEIKSTDLGPIESLLIGIKTK